MISQAGLAVVRQRQVGSIAREIKSIRFALGIQRLQKERHPCRNQQIRRTIFLDGHAAQNELARIVTSQPDGRVVHRRVSFYRDPDHAQPTNGPPQRFR